MGKIRLAKDGAAAEGCAGVKRAEEMLGSAVHWALSVYLFLLLAVWPFYFTMGYGVIGSDKSNFFRRVSLTVFWVLAPLLAVKLGIHIFLFMKDTKKRRAQRLRAFLKSMSVTDRFALLYGAVVTVSYLFSDYREDVLWGAGGWYLGFIPQLLFLGLYFMFSRFWRRRLWMIGLLLPVSTVVFALGYLNRFGVRPISMAYESPDYISTIGNINWYCGYLVTVLFGGVYLQWSGLPRQAWQKALMACYVLVGFATLVTQGSSSGILALMGVLIMLFCLSVTEGKRMKAFFETVLLLGAACILTYGIRLLFPNAINRQEITTELLTYSPLPFLLTAAALGMWLLVRECVKRGCYRKGLFKGLAWAGCICAGVCVAGFAALVAANTLRPGCIGPLSDLSVFTFSPTWGSNRGATWRAGVMCFAEQGFLKKLIGVGPDGMAAFLYKAGSPKLLALVRERFGTLTLTNAHNEWLSVLVNTGLLGLAGYAGMMTGAVVRFLKAGGAAVRQGAEKAAGGMEGRVCRVIAGACGLGVLAYTVNNIVSFQQTFGTAMVFLLLGVGEACMRKEPAHEP